MQQARQQNDELVAAQACDGVDVAQGLLEPVCNAFEQQVTDRVAQAVIDVLEAIQIEEQDCVSTPTKK